MTISEKMTTAPSGALTPAEGLTHSLDLGEEGLGMKPTRICSVDDCDRPHVARGWCNTHYQRWYDHGDPLATGTRRTASERFWSRVDTTDPDQCWLWTGALDPAGYGRFYDGRDYRAHRWAYEHLVGPIPDGLELDHLCHVRNCVHPRHLEPVTGTTNKQRTRLALSSHCARGHEFTPENTYTKPKRGTRECVTCRTLQRTG